MEMIKIIIMGTTPFSVVIAELISREGIYDVIGFSTKKEFIKENTLYGLPIIAQEKLKDKYKEEDFVVLNTIGYGKMNCIRERVNEELKK